MCKATEESISEFAGFGTHTSWLKFYMLEKERGDELSFPRWLLDQSFLLTERSLEGVSRVTLFSFFLNEALQAFGLCFGSESRNQREPVHQSTRVTGSGAALHQPRRSSPRNF